MTMTHEPRQSNHPIFMAIWVHVAIGVAALLFITAVGLLYYRSLTLVEPNSIVDVRGNPSLDGAVVEIKGAGLNAPLQTVFGQKKGYEGRFFLDRGSYQMTVRREGRTLFTRSFFLGAHRRMTLPLPELADAPLPDQDTDVR